jgi:putative SOS response-associated peptidase YedK
MFAGIWDTWRNRGEVITSCAIVTTPANELVAELHNRMPVILRSDQYDVWVDRRADRRRLRERLKPLPASELKMYRVSSAINQPENEGVDLLARVDLEFGTTLTLF